MQGERGQSGEEGALEKDWLLRGGGHTQNPGHRPFISLTPRLTGTLRFMDKSEASLPGSLQVCNSLGDIRCYSISCAGWHWPFLLPARLPLSPGLCGPLSRPSESLRKYGGPWNMSLNLPGHRGNTAPCLSPGGVGGR